MLLDKDEEGSPCLQSRKSLQTRLGVQQGLLDLVSRSLPRLQCGSADSQPCSAPYALLLLLPALSCLLQTLRGSESDWFNVVIIVPFAPSHLQIGCSYITSAPIVQTHGQGHWGRRSWSHPHLRTVWDAASLEPEWRCFPSRGLQYGRYPQKTRPWHFSPKGWRLIVFAFKGCTVSVETTYSAIGS